MSRYDQQSKDKKISPALLMAAVIMAGFGWLYFKHLPDNALKETKTQLLPLPFVPVDVRAINSLSISESIEGVDTPQADPGVDEMVFQQQESLFVLPDLEHSDALLREEIIAISPALAGWLNSDQLIGKYVVMVNDYSQGLRLEKHLRFIGLDQPFSVDQADESLFVAAESYRRYEQLAAAVNALDVQSTLIVYRKFRPLLVQVFNGFSYPAGYSLEDIFIKAAAVILAAPVIDGQVELVRHALYYQFADQHLEALNPVHKQMLRMGPENTRIIQNKLRMLVQGLVNLNEE